MSESLDVVRLSEDATGESHFDSFGIDRSMMKFAPPALPFFVSSAEKASGYVVVRLPAGWVGERHRSPHRQIAFCFVRCAESYCQRWRRSRDQSRRCVADDGHGWKGSRERSGFGYSLGCRYYFRSESSNWDTRPQALAVGHGIGRRRRPLGSPSCRLGLREEPAQTGFRSLADAALGDEAGDEPRRRHVEGVVRRRASSGVMRDRLDAALLPSRR